MARASQSKPRSLDAQNRVVLPPEVLRAIGVTGGDYVTFEVDGSDVRLLKVRWVPERR